MGPRFVAHAAIFYGLMAVAAAVWNGLRDRGFALYGESPGASVALALLAAAGTIFLGMAAYRLLPVLRKLAEELAPRLVDGARRSDLILVSVFSGVGEEMLFRGAVQPEFGLTVAALVFGAVHIGPDRRYLIWTLWAVMAGFVFGVLYETTGGLLAPVLAHCVHNAVSLLLWKRSREVR